MAPHAGVWLTVGERPAFLCADLAACTPSRAAGPRGLFPDAGRLTQEVRASVM